MWKSITVLASLSLIGLAAGTYVINTNEEVNCLGIETALWLVMFNHVVNAAVALIFTFGMERKVCSAFLMTVYCVF